jgi:hypothetical protein
MSTSSRRPSSILRAVVGRVRIAVACAAFVSIPGCVVTPPVSGLAGKPIGEFFDELKAELRDVHWRVRSDRAACGAAEPREVDLRNATITLDLARVGEANVDGQVRLVAIPLGAVLVSPFGAASAGRKWSQDIVMKLEVAGATKIHDIGEVPSHVGSVAGALNAAIDGFMRSSSDEPCIRLSSLKLTLVIDVRRDASGGFKLVVPAAELGVDASQRDVNTLTLSWDKVVSNALR